MSDIKTEQVVLSVKDGTSMYAHLAKPEGDPVGGLLVFQEAFGVNAHIRDVTERFAREGYLAIAPELYHRTAGDGFEAEYTDFDSVLTHLRSLKDDELAADIEAAFTYVREATSAHLPIGAIGYCMGGRTAFLAALTVPVDCAVSYYGGGISKSAYFPALTDRLGKDTKLPPVLLYWGGKDKNIGPEQIDEATQALRKAGHSFVNVEFSDADHGFFCDRRASYHENSAKQSWAMTKAFLQTYLDKK